MKNIILATTLLVAFSTASFAKEKNVDPKLLRELATTLKNSTKVEWTAKDQYRQAAFSFRNQTAIAFYTENDDELIGFGIRYTKKTLPAIITEAMKNKYSDWEVVDAIIFVDAEGNINYFADVQKNNTRLALKIMPNGKLSLYAKMPVIK